MNEQLKSPLQKVVAFLEGNGYQYAVIGGIAMAQWGHLRFTYDIDIKVFVPNMNYEEIRAALRTAFPEPARQNAPVNPFIVAVTLDQITVDFLLTLPGYEEQIIKRAVRRNLSGFSAWICSAEDLIIQKVTAGRSKDWPDVEALLIEQLNQLDEAYIEDWLVQFAEALEKPEMLTEYRRLVKKIKTLK
jgi:hypothetical protein